MSRRASGHATWTQDGREIRATDTVACAHCGNHKHTHDATGRRLADDDLGGWCARCAAYVCGPCADSGVCAPLEKRLRASERGVANALVDPNLERAIAIHESRMRLRRSIG
jgi:hypothetical protein